MTIPYVVTFFFQRNETNPEPGTFPENIQEPAAEIPETEPSKEGAPGQDPAQQETGTPALDTDSQTPDTDTQTPDTGTEGSGASQTAGKAKPLGLPARSHKGTGCHSQDLPGGSLGYRRDGTPLFHVPGRDVNVMGARRV